METFVAWAHPTGGTASWTTPTYPPAMVAAGPGAPDTSSRSGDGDCLNVREAASTGAKSLGCYRDGVLFHDLGESQEAGGITWRKVATPLGAQGWASQEFLAD